MRQRRNTRSREVSTAYKLTPQERKVLNDQLNRRNGIAPSPCVKVTEKEGGLCIAPDHRDLGTGLILLMNALRTTELAFLNFLLRQLANAGSQGREVDESGLNFMLAVVKGLEPKDQVEAMLGAQMAAVHMATMTFARRLAHVENIPQQDSAERAFNKLARTFAMQMEALKRYRTGGQQKVTVEHVTVNEGGQAIVGSVGIGEGCRNALFAVLSASVARQGAISSTTTIKPFKRRLRCRR